MPNLAGVRLARFDAIPVFVEILALFDATQVLLILPNTGMQVVSF